MRMFDTDVQKLKYMVLREVARRAFEDRLIDCYPEIPPLIAPGPEPTMRCCVYKERAIAAERVALAMGGRRAETDIIRVIPIACDECPVSTYAVGEDCRGCLAHRCTAACPCGAITIGEDKKARIDPDKCTACGACVYQCPFGAVTDRSFILDAVRMLREGQAGACRVYAVVAPSIEPVAMPRWAR